MILRTIRCNNVRQWLPESISSHWFVRGTGTAPAESCTWSPWSGHCSISLQRYCQCHEYACMFPLILLSLVRPYCLSAFENLFAPCPLAQKDDPLLILFICFLYLWLTDLFWFLFRLISWLEFLIHMLSAFGRQDIFHKKADEERRPIHFYFNSV